MRQNSKNRRPHPYLFLITLMVWIIVVYQGDTLSLSTACFAAAVVLQVVSSSTTTAGKLARGLRVLAWSVPLMVLYTLIQALLSPMPSAHSGLMWQGPTLPLVGALTLTTQGLVRGASEALRLWALLLGVMAITRQIQPDDVVTWLGKRFARAGLTISMILNFLPLMQQEFGRLREYIFARGRVGRDASWMRRLRALAAVLQALLMNALERSWSLAESMYVRGYGNARRTFYGKASWSGSDSAVFAGFVLVAAAAFARRLDLGYGTGRNVRTQGVTSASLATLGTEANAFLFMAAVLCMTLLLLWMGGNLGVHRRD